MGDNKMRENAIRSYVFYYNCSSSLSANYDDSGVLTLNKRFLIFMWFLVAGYAIWTIYLVLLVLVISAINWSLFMISTEYVTQAVFYAVLLSLTKSRIKVVNDIVKEIRIIDRMFRLSWSETRYFSQTSVFLITSLAAVFINFIFSIYTTTTDVNLPKSIVIKGLVDEVLRLQTFGFQWSLCTLISWLLVRLRKINEILNRSTGLHENYVRNIVSALRVLRTTRNLSRAMMRQCGLAITIHIICVAIGLISSVFYATVNIIANIKTRGVYRLLYLFVHSYNFYIFLTMFDLMEFEWSKMLQTLKNMKSTAEMEILDEKQTALSKMERAISLLSIAPLKFQSSQHFTLNKKLVAVMAGVSINYFFLLIQLQFRLI